MSLNKHKVFISYHHDDQDEVEDFIETYDYYHDIFIARALGVGMEEDIINSTDTDYVMQRIRELYLEDSTVTIVIIGQYTWTRRYVDWEIQASLRHGEDTTPNGLLGIVLSSAGQSPRAPERLSINLSNKDREKYAEWYWMPSSANDLGEGIDMAFKNRILKADLIDNPRERFLYNKSNY